MLKNVIKRLKKMKEKLINKRKAIINEILKGEKEENNKMEHNDKISRF